MENPRIEFSHHHTRLSPCTAEELYTLETSDIRKIIAAVLESSIYSQLSKKWRRRIGRVRDQGYEPEYYVDEWVDFIVRVLMPKEDGWQKHRDRAHFSANKQRDSYINALRLSVALPHCLLRQQHLQKSVDLEEISAVDAKELLLWCELAEKILGSMRLEEFTAQNQQWAPPIYIWGLVGLKQFWQELCDFSQRQDTIMAIQLEFLQPSQADYSQMYSTLREHLRKLRSELTELSQAELVALQKSLRSYREVGMYVSETGSLIAAN